MIIDTLQALLNNRFEDSRTKIKCYVNAVQPREFKCIRLFYTANNNFITNKLAKYYNQGVQITMRHPDYDKCREIIFNILEYLQGSSKIGAIYFRLDTMPEYLGEDEQQGGHVWAFSIILQGGK